MCSLNCGGRLVDLNEPKVMGILNVTPDSFYAASRQQTDEAVAQRVRQMRDEGADFVDVGAFSTRPGADDVPPGEEMARLRRALAVVRREWPDVPVSVDTFRADVARMAVEECGADIINDISGGTMDERMFATVASLRVPYVLMHIQGVPATMQQAPHYDCLRRDVMVWLAERVDSLRQLGARDIIIDPGFGFGKTLAHNYELMNHLDDFREFHLPLLVGISRKSMIYKLVGGTPETALGGTVALHTAALLKGANILRVHDVRAAVEVRSIFLALTTDGQSAG